jgi:hypothetical protein
VRQHDQLPDREVVGSSELGRSGNGRIAGDQRYFRQTEAFDKPTEPTGEIVRGRRLRNDQPVVWRQLRDEREDDWVRVRVGTHEHDRRPRPAPNVARDVLTNTDFGVRADVPCRVQCAEVE